MQHIRAGRSLSQLALDCLDQLFDIARWFYVQVDGGDRATTPKFVPPPPELDGPAKTREALEKLRLAEAKYESVLQALEDETKKRLRSRTRRKRACHAARAG